MRSLLTLSHIEDVLIAFTECVRSVEQVPAARRLAEKIVAEAWDVTSQTVHSQIVRELGLSGPRATAKFDLALQQWLDGDSTALRILLAKRFDLPGLDRLDCLIRLMDN